MTEVASVIVYNSKNECLLKLREDNPINAARRELFRVQ